MTRRWYRLLLYLYPKGFRDEFGDEMVELAHAQRCRPWLLIRDTVTSLAAAHAGARRERRHRKRKRPGAPWASTTKDFEVALRGWKRSPGFAAVAIVTIALGIGANTAIFSVVNGVVLRPLPFAEPDRLVTLSSVYTSDGRRGRMSLPDVDDIRESVPSVDALAPYWSSGLTLTGFGEPAVVRGARVGTGLLDTFGLAPVLGRDIRRDENVPGAARVVVVGHRFWQETLGGVGDVLGRTLTLDGESFEIVGVAPPGFDFPERTELWRPAYQDLERCGRGCHGYLVVGRLAPGATPETLEAELTGLAARLADAYPDTNANKVFGVSSLSDATVGGDVRLALYVLLGAVAMVLLIASANVAHLLLARASARTEEMSIRSALGASRFRLVRQLFVESFLLAAIGGALGVVLGYWALSGLIALAPESLPRLDQVSLDATVLLFALAAVVATCFLFGIVPALSVSREALRSARRVDDYRPRSSRSRSVLLAGEVALSLVLLFAAGLLLRSFTALRDQALGFDRDNVLTFSLVLPDASYPDPEDAVRFFEMLEERLATLPGVDATGAVFGGPMGDTRMMADITFLDRPAPPPGEERGAAIRAVTPGYARALGVSLVRGRFVEPRDQHGSARVVVVNESFARRFYPGRDPLGEQIRLHGSFRYPESEPRTIVGIVSDIRARSVAEPAEPEAWAPQAQMGSSYLTVLVRGAVGGMLAPVTAEVHRLDANLPLRDVEMLSSAVARSLGASRFFSLLVTLFAGLAVVLASVGLYGVVSYVVAQRRREIGLRIALGATARDVSAHVVAQGLRPALAGLIAGVVASLSSAPLLRSMLYNVDPLDAATLAAAAATLLAIAVVALWIPARRASSLSPVSTLDSD